MRIALATDAWSPQTNGVVRTLSITVAELERAGHVVEVVHPGSFRTVPCPTYPEIRLAVFPYRELAQAARPVRARGGAHRHRGSARAGRSPLVQAARTAVHDFLSHAVSRIRAGSGADSARADLRAPAAVSRRRGAHPGRDAVDDAAARGARVSATSRSGAAVWTPRCFVRSRRAISICRGRSGSTSGGWPWKRASRTFSRSTCRAASSSWVAGPRRASCARAIRRRCSPGSGTARRLPRWSRTPTCSSFPAAPIPSAWCCSKRWPAACPSRPTR